MPGFAVSGIPFEHILQGLLRCQWILPFLQQHVAKKDSRRQRFRHSRNNYSHSAPSFEGSQGVGRDAQQAE